MTLKTVLFDAGDVLYHRPRRGAALAEFFARHGRRAPQRDHPEQVKLKRRAHAGRISRDEYFDAVLDLCGVQGAAGRAEGRRVLDHAQRDIEFFEGVPETLHRLKAAGLRLGVVTNTYDSTDSKHRWFTSVGIEGLWDSFATSCELRVSKPDARIYMAALDPLGIAPTDAAFVGHAAVELDGAKALGITTIAFNRDDDSVTADYVITRFADLLDVVEAIARDGRRTAS